MDLVYGRVTASEMSKENKVCRRMSVHVTLMAPSNIGRGVRPNSADKGFGVQSFCVFENQPNERATCVTQYCAWCEARFEARQLRRSTGIKHAGMTAWGVI